MFSLLRNFVLPPVAGCAVGVLVVLAIESISVALYPLPQNVNTDDETAIAAHVETLPPAAFLLVLAAWIGALAGSCAAALLAKRAAVAMSLIVGGVVFAGSIAMLLQIPHPRWMGVAALVGVPLATLAGYFIAAKLRRWFRRSSPYAEMT